MTQLNVFTSKLKSIEVNKNGLDHDETISPDHDHNTHFDKLKTIFERQPTGDFFVSSPKLKGIKSFRPE